MHRWFCIFILALAATVACSFARGQTPVQVPPIDLGVWGTPFSRGVRGQAVPSTSNGTSAIIGTEMNLNVARGSSIRGVAGGLEADFYDWRTRNNDQRTTTLDYLRFARDYDARLVITANIRGLAEPDPSPSNPNGRRFYDTSIPTLTKMAADWVRYTNVIAQTYRQGDVIADPADQAILDSLVWSTGQIEPNSGKIDVNDLLPAVGEAPLPKVTYWEIGNEPRVPLHNAYNFTNSFTFLAPGYLPPDDTHKYDFHERYASITAAMRAVDPTIKVGPALQWLSQPSERAVLDSILYPQANGEYLPIDFLGYHPYQTIYGSLTGGAPIPTDIEIESGLRSVYSTHSSRIATIRSMITASGRDPDSIELMASEANVSSHRVNGTIYEAQMGHALGTVEEVFSFARLGLSDAHYWVWPGDPWDRTRLPVYKAHEGLRDHMGDVIASVYSSGNHRLYTTRDSESGEIAVWGLNFSNSADATLNLTLDNLPEDGYTASLMTLKATAGPTTLFSANLPVYMPGGPTNEVEWETTPLNGVDLSDYALTLRAATIAVLVITPNPLRGDFDENLIVDGADLDRWKSNFGLAGAASHGQGDADGDQDVDGADFLTWQRQVGKNFIAPAAATAAIPVPEPCCGGLAIALAAMAGCSQQARRIRRRTGTELAKNDCCRCVLLIAVYASISVTTRAGSTPISRWSRPWKLNANR